MDKNKDKKQTYVLRVLMMISTVVLIILFFATMSMVGKIQGTARVVNYAGLVRGKTQRIIKMEDAGQEEDAMIDDVAAFIDGLRNGSDSLNLVRLDDYAFQSKMEELDDYFQSLEQEIYLVREKGYENSEIIAKSEQFFQICDEATGLAEAYSQRKASALNILEKIVMADIAILIGILGIELFKALRYAAQNRILQKKVYLDEATGLPNKNKCEEILNDETVLDEKYVTAVCVFDLNNLRTINNNLGHDKGDEYIRSFAQQMRLAVPEQYFAGRNGGDEFLAVLTDVNHTEVEECLEAIRRQTEKYSRLHPEMPISYAAGYALSSDFKDATMRSLFRHADKNMYIDKNRAKMQEAAEKQKMKRKLLEEVRKKGYHFSDCLYCDALLDQYEVLRSGDGFFLAQDGNYSGAVEQIVKEFSTEETRRQIWSGLQLAHISETLTGENRKTEILYCKELENGKVKRGRLTLLFGNDTGEGKLHHFLLVFETFSDSRTEETNEKSQLMRYYEQMKQSILENGNYVDALMETAQAVYMVDLTHDRLEKFFEHSKEKEFKLDQETPCSYGEYCKKRSAFVTEETLENYRIVDSSEKLLKRFGEGTKQVTVEYREKGVAEVLVWLQKTVLMSQELVFDEKTGQESVVIRGIILFKNTSAFHEKEEEEKERLQSAFEAADSESKAKTEFMNRMSHDIRTPINGIMGMLHIIRKSEKEPEKVEECLGKIELSTSHLLALVNDVLDMSKIQAEEVEESEEAFDLVELMDEVASVMDAQITETGILHKKHRKNIRHTHLIGNPLHLRQIMLNLFSNAVKYNKTGGRVDTYAEEISDDGTTAMYEFKIVDTGIGMSPAFVKEELFKPFTQEKSADARTQYKGTGLGMSIVKGLVEKMNGTIWVESEPDQGTTFIFRMPFQIDTSVSGQMGPEKKEENVDFSGMNILLVEDNEINMEIAQFYLEEAWIEVDPAWDGQEAVEKFAQSEPYAYDMILMDIMMPVMGGLQATEKIRSMERADAKTVSILAMTAQANAESSSECRKAGMNDYIEKPIEAEKLWEIISKNLTEKTL